MKKAVAKVAAARTLPVRLFWMLPTNTAYPEIARIESAARCCGRQKLDPEIDWALLHPDQPVQQTGLARLRNKAVFQFRTGPAAGCSQATSWSRLRPHSWMVERLAPSQGIEA
jgi:hypothetical protein